MSGPVSTLAGLVSTAIADYLAREDFHFCDEDLAGMKEAAHQVLGVAAALSVPGTLRDHFAAAALPAIIARAASQSEAERVVAAFAYEMADAMLAERQKVQARHE